jgi:hypothetical protein
MMLSTNRFSGANTSSPGHSRTRWKGALVVAAVALTMASFFAQHSGTAIKVEQGAEVAYSKARHLLHDADAENRRVRPLPLSLAAQTRASGEFSV